MARPRGVGLAAGTSAGGVTSGFGDYVGCLETYAWLGFTPQEIIEIANRNAAALSADRRPARRPAGPAPLQLVMAAGIVAPSGPTIAQ